jgi:large subunit ribosomal protein L18
MNSRLAARLKRRQRIRRKITGSEARPRLSVFRSDRHIYAQIIDDGSGSTLAHASSLDAGLRQQAVKGGSRDAAGKVGVLVAERAKKAGVTKVVFDRGGYRYHGRVKALAEAARQGGLEF